MMQQPVSRQLYAYWDSVRNGRVAPRRFEIEPARIAPLLPQTFIAESAGRLGYRFRLAGTKICEQFGRELRGADLVELWGVSDRAAMASLLRNIFCDAAVGYGRFRSYTATERHADFELLLLPLIHGGEAVNRILGAITAIEPPFWLGAEPLARQELIELNLHWPDGVPAFMAKGGAEVISLAQRRFRMSARNLRDGGGRSE
ncbi:MAG TPA: PAS domain-containing protein [Methyloceanibacter sp.]|nr:PAS domain-containing protein [Methyloceanibacter sp.]